MTTPKLKLYPTASLDKSDLQQRLEKKLKDVNDVNSFYNSINNIKEMINFFSKTKTINQKRNIRTTKR